MASQPSRLDFTGSQGASRTWPAIVALSLLGFGVNASIGVKLDRLGAFNDYNVVFTSDTPLYVSLLAQGAYYSRRHPLIHVLCYPPVWAGAKILTSLTGRSEPELRRSLLLLLVPLLQGLKTPLLMLCLGRLGIPFWFRVIIALIDIASSGRLVFGSILDSYGVFAPACTLGFCLAAGSAATPSDVPRSKWFACGVITAGANITGVIPFFIVLLAALLPDCSDWKNALYRTSRIAAATAGVVLGLHLASGPLVSSIRPDLNSSIVRRPKPGAKSTTRAWFHFRPASVAQQIPFIVADTFVVGSRPLTQATHYDPRAYVRPRARLKGITHRLYGPSLLLVSMVAAILCMGGYGLFRAGGIHRRLAVASFAIFLYYIGIFVFWGTANLFLYTLLWQSGFLVLLAGIWFLPVLARRVGLALCVALLGFEIVLNLQFLDFVFSVL